MNNIDNSSIEAYAFAYLPEVLASREHHAARAQALLDGLQTEAQLLSFVLGFITLRVGCLRDIPKWLRESARLCEPRSAQIACELREAAALEQQQRMLLMEDLVEVHGLLPRMSLASLVRGTPEPRVARHARMRALVPTREEPLVALAVELELAEFGRAFGPALLEACRWVLGPDTDVCRFIRARVDNLEARVRARRERIEQVLQAQPERAGSWARVGRELVGSYVDALEACVEAYPRARAQLMSSARV